MNDNIGNELADQLFTRLDLDYIDNGYWFAIISMSFDRGKMYDDSSFLSASIHISTSDGKHTISCASRIDNDEYNDLSYIIKQTNDFYNNIYAKFMSEGIHYG